MWRMTLQLIGVLLLDSPLDGASKLVEAAGKTLSSFICAVLIVLAFSAYKLFGKDSVWVRVLVFLVVILCLFALVFILLIPHPKMEPPLVKPTPAVVQPQKIESAPAAKQCTGTKPVTFTPATPGVLQKMPDGRYIDLGDGGGGTRLYEWKVSWKAPATVTSVDCAAGRNENVIGKGKNGDMAECVGSTNGGNDAITLTVSWDGPCEKQ
jgi:hypothetical protein